MQPHGTSVVLSDPSWPVSEAWGKGGTSALSTGCPEHCPIQKSSVGEMLVGLWTSVWWQLGNTDHPVLG